MARRCASVWPIQGEQLTLRFWPGPLTLVVPKAEAIVSQATAGLSSVGLRSPNHPLALELLLKFAGPIAAPSANRSTRVSPTTAEHVRRELGGAVDIILDGGPCQVGIESTVLDLTTTPPIILRPGGVTREQIEAVIGSVRESNEKFASDKAVKSPGQQEVHYSPAVPALRFASDQAKQVASWCLEHRDLRVAILVIESSLAEHVVAELPTPPGKVIQMPHDPAGYARQLYAALHDADAASPAVIFIELPQETVPWTAVRNRLLRATRPFEPDYQGR
jgi:L-threonylcarbamoyladenylate synthase